MSGYILCQVKRAKLPYYIENISTNIYSIEELCFYFYHNIYLLDSTILNEELCFWIRDQLGLKKLAENLYKHLDDENMKVGDFILPVFKEINYLSLEEFRKLNKQIQQLAREPEVLRQKRKGDYLMEHGKYVNAIKVYQKALRQELSEQKEHAQVEAENVEEEARSEEPQHSVAIEIEMPEEEAVETEAQEHPQETPENREETPEAHKEQPELLLGKQFVGEIYHNMGCAYARLFQMEEAIRCFETAYSQLHTLGAVKSLLYAVYMEHGIDAFVEKARELEVDEERQEEIYVEVEETAEDIYDTPEGQTYRKLLEEKKQGNEAAYQQGMEQLLQQMTAEYHKSTGY